MVLTKLPLSAQGGLCHGLAAHQEIVETGLAGDKLRVIPSGVNGVPLPVVQLDIVPGVLFAAGPVVLVIGPAFHIGVGDTRRVQQDLEGGGIAIAHRAGAFAVVAQNAAGGTPGVVGGAHTQGVIDIVLSNPVFR